MLARRALAGVVADAAGSSPRFGSSQAITATSGLAVLLRMSETLQRKAN